MMVYIGWGVNILHGYIWRSPWACWSVYRRICLVYVYFNGKDKVQVSLHHFPNVLSSPQSDETKR